MNSTTVTITALVKSLEDFLILVYSTGGSDPTLHLAVRLRTSACAMIPVEKKNHFHN
jgi:hypothetical protein